MSDEQKTDGMSDGSQDGGMPNGDGGQPTAAELACVSATALVSAEVGCGHTS